ncbi:MAG TPA: proton-conducting transporter membrane subunit, partial [Spirochaetia bacterium]|nr:proton-conducting transporter membrane subunit [Spirochaetia bacterium]
VVSALSTPEKEAETIDDYRGLAGRSPWLAAVFTVSLLSLAGLPLTAGFVGKFIILSAGAGAQLWALIIILAVNTTISVFYYVRVVSAIYRGAEGGAEGRTEGAAVRSSGGARPAGGATVARQPFVAALALALLAIIVVFLGVYPSPMLSLIGLFTGQ